MRYDLMNVEDMQDRCDPRRDCCAAPHGEPHLAFCVHGARMNCQNGGDVCLAGNADGICCPDDSCDIDDGIRLTPNAS